MSIVRKHKLTRNTRNRRKTRKTRKTRKQKGRIIRRQRGGVKLTDYTIVDLQMGTVESWEATITAMNLVCSFIAEAGFTKSALLEYNTTEYYSRIYSKDDKPHGVIIYKKEGGSTVHVAYICAIRGEGLGYSILSYDIPMNIISGTWPRTVFIPDPITSAVDIYKTYGFMSRLGVLEKTYDGEEDCIMHRPDELAMKGHSQKILKMKRKKKDELAKLRVKCSGCGNSYLMGASTKQDDQYVCDGCVTW